MILSSWANPYLTTSLFENSTPYQEAMITLKSNPEAIELLGEPIEIEGEIKGGINIQNDGGNATFEIPVTHSYSNFFSDYTF